ncbi:MAG: DNA glycosylase [Peptoniphilaceae bacterium]|nr:DNA glycosylase [Peptoniphilaceae bacterium]MDY6019443.1 DNA glycosylase [Anaerococcus sp.]
MDRYIVKKDKKLNIKQVGEELVLKTDSFDPKHVFECGQCFNFSLQEDGSYTAVFMRKIINARKEDDKIIFRNISMEDFYEYFYDYFDFGEDYEAIKASISKNDSIKKACDYGYGIRILNQEVFETIISFIISANNQIPRIKKAVRIISERYGDYLGSYMGKSYYSFPEASDLAKAKPEDLREFARVGFRDKRIVETARLIANGYLDFEKDKLLTTEELRKKLMDLPGIGPKVADCILLFAYHRRETFPVDVWIKRVMETLFIGKEVPKKQITTYAYKYFGDLAGYVQQYLFFYGRENAIGK